MRANPYIIFDYFSQVLISRFLMHLGHKLSRHCDIMSPPNDHDFRSEHHVIADIDFREGSH